MPRPGSIGFSTRLRSALCTTVGGSKKKVVTSKFGGRAACSCRGGVGGVGEVGLVAICKSRHSFEPGVVHNNRGWNRRDTFTCTMAAERKQQPWVVQGTMERQGLRLLVVHSTDSCSALTTMAGDDRKGAIARSDGERRTSGSRGQCRSL